MGAAVSAAATKTQDTVTRAAMRTQVAVTSAATKTQELAKSVNRRLSSNTSAHMTASMKSMRRSSAKSSLPQTESSILEAADLDVEYSSVIASTVGLTNDLAKDISPMETEQRSLNAAAVIDLEAKTGSELVSPIDSPKERPEALVEDEEIFEARVDLGAPQRYLITLLEAQNISIDVGEVFFRFSFGKRGQESRTMPVGDQLIQGILKEWTGTLKFNEEFYFEFADPDSWILIELKHRDRDESGRKTDKVVGEAKLHAKPLKSKPAEQWISLSNGVGSVRIRGMKVGRTEDMSNEEDEQTAMKAFQKHAVQLSTMMHLRIRVIQALDIPAMDDTGTSDPYVVMTCGSTKKRTKVQMKTLRPKWHEDFDFFFPAGTTIPEMKIEMLDQDALSRDDFMGQAILSVGGLTDLKPRLEWLALKSGDTDVGRLQLAVALQPRATDSESPLRDLIVDWFYTEEAMMGFWEGMAGGGSGKRAAAMDSAGSGDLPPATLKINVLRGRDLLAKDRGGTSDPYVRLCIGDDLVRAKKTDVKKKTLSPTWMQEFQFQLMSSNRMDALMVECFDKDFIGADESLGRFAIPLDTLVPDQEIRQWYPLVSVDEEKNDGQIELQIVLSEVPEKFQRDDQYTGNSPGRKSVKNYGIQQQIKSLQVVVTGGRGMPKMDSGPFGKCDPYLKLNCEGQDFKTKVIKRTLTPTWNETFNFSIQNSLQAELRIECYDYDMLGEHDFVGALTILLKDLAMKRSEWFKLVHPDNPSFNAEVFLTLDPIYESLEELEAKRKEERETQKVSDMSSILSINIIAARGLEAMDSNGLSDPYAVLQVENEKRKTKVISKDLNPQWNEKFDLVVTDVNGALRLQVYDKDLIGSDDLIGETIIPLSTIVGKKLAQKWYTILRNSNITGEVLLGLKLPSPPGLQQPENQKAIDGSADATTDGDESGLRISSSLGLESTGNFCCPPHVRIYLAATLPDMVRERHLIHDNVIPVIRRYCESRSIICITVDMRLGLVEESQAITRLCLQELELCSIFLCFLAERYGAPVEIASDICSIWPWLEAFNGKSIVEIEIAAAIVQDPEKFRNRSFAYFRDSSYLDSIPGLVRGDYAESDAQYVLALEALKKRLKSIEGLPVTDNYPDPETVMPRLENDLRKCVSQMYSKQTKQRLLTVQRSCLLQYCRDPVAYYYLDLDIAQRLNNYVAFDDRCVLVIVGPPGSGKTSLLRTWLNLYETRRHQSVFLFPHFDLGMEGVESANGILRRLLFEIKKHFSLDQQVPTSYIQIKRTLLLWLRMASSKGKICLVIDGADGLDEPDDGIGAFLDCIPRTLPTGLRLILSMETGCAAYDQVLKRVNFCKTIDVGTLSIKARRSVSQSILLKYLRKIDDHDPRMLIQRSSGLPLYLRVIMAYYVKTNIFSPSLTLEEASLGLIEHIEDAFKKEHPTLVERTFTSICCSRRGMTDEELISVCGVNRLLWAHFSIEIRDIVDCLSGLINFHHSSLNAAIVSRFLPTQEQQQKVTVMLANFFENRPISFRKIEEYPWHLCGNARYWMESAQPSEYRQVWSKLRDCLTNIDFFLEIYKDEFVSDLHDYWNAMANVYDMTEEYKISIDRYATTAASTGPTDRIVPIWHIAKCQTKIAQFFVDSSRFEEGDEMYARALESWALAERKEKERAMVALAHGETVLTWGKLSKAEEILKTAVAMLELSHGMETKECAKALYLVAEAMRHQKKEAEAIPFCQRAYQILSRYLSQGTKDYDVKAEGIFAKCALALGTLYEIDGEAESALSAYKQAVSSFQKTVGCNHPSYCQALEGVSNICISQGLLRDASESYQLLLPIKEEMSILGGSLGDVTTVQNNLAALFVKLGDLKAAEVMYRKTIRLREQQFGHSHPAVARSLEMLANICCESGDITDAAFLLQRALGIRERVFGKDSVETAATMVHLSSVECRKGQFKMGRDLFKRWIKVIANSLGAEHPTCVWALNWLDRWPEGGAPGTKLKKTRPGSATQGLPGGIMYVTVVRGRNLAAMDNGKSSDPYVIVQFGTQIKKTMPKLKTLNPEWNEKFEFTVTPDDRLNMNLVFQCFDKDLMGDDDDMGSFRILLQQAYRRWHSFDDQSKPGEIEIEILLMEEFQPEPSIRPTKMLIPTGTTLEQIEAKKFKDQERLKAKLEAAAIQQEQELKSQSRKQMNKASLQQIHGLNSAQEGNDETAEHYFGSAEENASMDAEELGGASIDTNGNQPTTNGTETEDQRTGGSSKLLALDMNAQELMEMALTGISERPDGQGSSALHLAALKGKEDKLNLLLVQGADVNVLDNDNMTPLHYAAGAGNTGIVAILVDAMANIGARDLDGDTALHIALQEKQYEVLTFLISKGSEFVNFQNNKGDALLHLVAHSTEDQSDLLLSILKAGGDATLQNLQGETPLDLAEAVADRELDSKHHQLMCEFLGIAKHLQESVTGGPLKAGVAEKCWDYIEHDDKLSLLKMLQSGMDINGRFDESGLTPLMLAIKLQKEDIVDLLTRKEMNVDLQASTITGLTALHYIAIYGNDHILEIISKHNPNPDVGDRKLFRPLHYACQHGNLSIVTFLLEKCGADILAVTEDKQTALHLAAKHGQARIIEYLISAVEKVRNLAFVNQEQAVSAALNMTDNYGNTALHYAATSDHNEEILKLLLLAKGNPSQVNKEGQSALDVATSAHQGILMNLLSQAAVEIEGTVIASKEMLLLCYSVQDGKVDEVIRKLNGSNIDVMAPVDEVGDTLLHTAASAGQIEIMRELVKLGAYVFVTNSLGCTPLHAAAMQGQVEAVKWLLTHEADPRSSDSEGYTPIHYAAGEGHLDCLKVLLDIGRCDITLKTFQGLTVLHVAVTEDRLHVVQYLLSCKPELASIPDRDGVLPIDYAKTAQTPDQQIISLLQAASTGSKLMVSLCMTENFVAGSRFASSKNF